MARKTEETNKLNVRSPRGTLVWPKLTEPDHGSEKFPCSHKWGDYKTRFRLDRRRPGVAEFLEKLDAHMEVAKAEAEKAFADLPVKDRKRIGEVAADDPYSVVYDDETEEETDFVELNFKMRAGGERKKDGKEWKAKPALFDAKGNPITKKLSIFSGTTASINADYEPYFVAGTGKYGISRRLNAVQIFDLVSSGGQRSASQYGFEEDEDGFSVNDYVEESDEDQSGSHSGGDADDDQDPQF